MGSRMNLRFSSSNTLRVERLETLDKEAIVFFDERSIEEEERGDYFRLEGSRLRLGFAKSKEAEDMIKK